MVLFFRKTILIIACLIFTSCLEDEGVAPSFTSKTGFSTPDGCPSEKIIFVSATTSQGNLGGVSGADTICDADANRPSCGGTYKAMLSDYLNRQACSTINCGGGAGEHIDWVLTASTTYIRPDGTTIGTTNTLGIFTTIDAAADPTNNSFVFTGMTGQWVEATHHCSRFTNSTAGVFSIVGSPRSTNLGILQASNSACSSFFHLYCVEQ